MLATARSWKGASRFMQRHAARIFIALALAPLLGGCMQTVRLAKVDVQEMTFGVRKEDGKLCPGSSVQMSVVATVIDPHGNTITLRSWEGVRPTFKNTKYRLDYRDFVFSSAHGTIDKDGWFFAASDPLRSVESGFVIDARRREGEPVFAQTIRLLPEYSCVQSFASNGKAGASGSDRFRSGGTGYDSKDGRVGRDGDDGEDGAQFRAYVSFAKTPHYDKLLAIKFGEAGGFLLAPPDRTFNFAARGGAGGDGGAGGNGSDGTDGDDSYCEQISGREECYAAQDGGDGGHGGDGGNGGRGGDGGNIELILDTRYPELAALVKTDVAGGAGGLPGDGGPYGSGGRGGVDTLADHDGIDGWNGEPGNPGMDGESGNPGKASVRRGDVAPHFRGLPGISPLD